MPPAWTWFGQNRMTRMARERSVFGRIRRGAGWFVPYRPLEFSDAAAKRAPDAGQPTHTEKDQDDHKQHHRPNPVKTDERHPCYPVLPGPQYASAARQWQPNLLALRARSYTPVEVTVTDSGLPAALLGIRRVAVFGPTLDGVVVSDITQMPPG